MPGQTDDERQQILNMLDGLGDFGDRILERCARSLYTADGEILASFGVWPLWPAVGRAWAMLSEEVLRDYPLTLHRSVSQLLPFLEERDEYRRLEATIRQGHSAGHRWIRHLGFRREGLMQNYGIGGTISYHLYARIRPWHRLVEQEQ